MWYCSNMIFVWVLLGLAFVGLLSVFIYKRFTVKMWQREKRGAYAKALADHERKYGKHKSPDEWANAFNAAGLDQSYQGGALALIDRAKTPFQKGMAEAHMNTNYGYSGPSSWKWPWES